jgi:hypothetical protein
MALLDLLEGHATALVHEVDETEIARAEDDDLAIGDVVLGTFLRGVCTGRLAHGEADHRVLLVPTRELGDAARRQRALDELVEPVAVALIEGRPLGLAVV